MNGGDQDALWPYFAPLWTDLRQVSGGILLAGGYGLFLKQRWLRSKIRFLAVESGAALASGWGERIIVDGVRTVVEVQQWLDQAPRVTKDFDFIAHVDLIASAGAQGQIEGVLQRHAFAVVPGNARWQFKKEVNSGPAVLLDFHAPSPPLTRADLRVDSRRVKPRPSLGQRGIHGRENREAVVAHLHPFSFPCDGVEVVLPNAVTFAIMKLIAMRDRWAVSQDSEKSAEERSFAGGEATKHAQDVCRVIAMMTREENDMAANVLASIRSEAVFTDAASVFANFIQDDEGWGTRTVASSWQTGDFRLIREVLASWF